MPKFSANVPHTLGKEKAKARLEGLLSKVSSVYGDQVSSLEQSWNDATLTFAITTYGFKIEGDLEVREEDVQLDGKLPFAAAMFKGKIEQSLKGELEKALRDRKAEKSAEESSEEETA